MAKRSTREIRYDLLLLALVLTVGLMWVAKRSDRLQREVEPVPVVLRNVPDNMVLDDEPLSHRFASFSITGKRRVVIRAADEWRWKVEIDLQNPLIADAIRDGSTVIPIGPELLKCESPWLLDEIRILPDSFMPEAIVLRTYLRTKTVPVRLRLQGEPAEGREIAGTRLQPSRVQLTGPPAVLEAINEIKTETGNIRQIDRTLEGEVSLELPDGVRLLEGQPQRVHFTVEVRSRREPAQ